MENNKIRTLLYVNLVATALLIVLVVLLLKWTIPSTKYAGWYLKMDGGYMGKVVSVTDLPGNKIRVVFTDTMSYGGIKQSVCEVEEDLVTFEKA